MIIINKTVAIQIQTLQDAGCKPGKLAKQQLHKQFRSILRERNI
jgi:hypothetical protein